MHFIVYLEQKNLQVRIRTKQLSNEKYRKRRGDTKTKYKSFKPRSVNEEISKSN